MKLTYISLARVPTDRAHGYAIMKMCEEFATEGVEVTLLVPTRTHGITTDPFEYHHIKHNFSIRKLWTTDFLGLFDNARVPLFFIDLAIFLFSLRRQKWSPETIVYTRDYLSALVVRSEHIVIEVHTIPQKMRLFLRAIRHARKVFVISNSLKHILIARGVPPEKIVVAPDAVDLSEFNISPSRREVWKDFDVDPDKKIILYTGHFYGWKGADTLARASSLLPQDVNVVLMGGIDKELADFQKRYGGRAHIIGFQPREKLAAFLKSADVLVLPNSGKEEISSHYTSPLKLFQYMASGAPIIAADLPSIREILSDETCFWFEPDNEHDLAARIQYAISHPEEAAQKAARAADEVRTYTWDARVRSILSHIGEH